MMHRDWVVVMSCVFCRGVERAGGGSGEDEVGVGIKLAEGKAMIGGAGVAKRES